MTILRILALRLRLFLLKRRLHSADYTTLLRIRSDMLRTLQQINILRLR